MKLLYLVAVISFVFILNIATQAAITQGTFAGVAPSSWSYPHLINDDAGNTLLMFKNGNSDIRILKYDGSSWTTHTSFTTTMINNDADFSGVTSIGSDFDLAIDGSNNIHIAMYFYKSAANRRGVLYGYHNGTTWDFELIEDHYHTGGWISAREPRIIIDNNNYPHIIYEYSDVDGTREYAIRHRHKESGSWSNFTNIHTWSGTVDTGLHEVFLHDVYLHTNNNLYCYFGYDNAANTSPDIFLSIMNNTTNSWSAKTEVIDGVTSDISHSIQGQFIDGANVYLGFTSSNNTANVKINSNAPSSSAVDTYGYRNSDLFRTDGFDYYFMVNPVTEEWDDNWENVTLTGYVYLRVFDGSNWHSCNQITALNSAAGCNESTYIIRPDGKVIMIFSNYDVDNTLKYAIGTLTDFLPSGCFTPQGAVQPPTLAATTAASSIATTTASSGGNVTADDGDAVTARGVCWNTTGTPTTADSKTTNGTGTGVFTSNLTGLTANTTYYVRAYATNGGGSGYGAEVSFTTLAIVPNAPTVNNPAITTLDVTLDVNGNNAATTFAIQETSTGDYVQANGSLAASAVWQDNATWGTVTVTGLTRATEYTFQVKARNTDNVETAFGATQAATTLQDSPTLASTTAASAITANSASSGGNISDDGGSAITARGVCWNLGGAPTTADDKTTDGTGAGIFTSSITGLSPATTYYVRAYATNGIGTSYGNEISFTTLNLSVAISNVNKNSDIEYAVTADITNPSSIPITGKGFVWSIAQNPTIASNSGSTANGTGSTSYTDNATVTVGPGYYVRAYITTAGGTYYSDQIHFGVVPTLPEWGLIFLAAGFILGGGWFMYRRVL